MIVDSSAILAIFISCILSFILVAGKLNTNLSFDIREAAFEKLQALSFSYYDRKAVGWLMAVLEDNDVPAGNRIRLGFFSAGVDERCGQEREDRPE